MIPIGESEFGGGPGLIQQWQIDNGEFTSVEQVWSDYATDPDSAAAPDPKRVGLASSYVSTARVIGEVETPGEFPPA
jgi:hypothetical protein